MPPWLQQLINPQLLIPLAIVLFSVLGTVAKKLQEQKVRREMLRRRQQLELEALRTGRIDAPAPVARPASPQAQQQRRLEELAARRKAQLEELRRRQQAQAGGAIAAPPVQRPPVQRPTVHAPPAQRPSHPARAPARAAPTPRPAPSRPPRSATPRPATRQSQRPDLDPVANAIEAAVLSTRFPGAPATAAQRAAPRQGPGGVPPLRDFSPAAMRRAILLAEVLAPPVALRQ